ncbi:winged helix-turn-helix transcriptional regulator [Nocardioides xinjiangensis]|uniref:winged helix-turn-helix transcriptional regulator n=1 Tax=Nocardioides xinjiangensis TaxID=2817376 RepID=UPI001B309618|nr:helix-turn-helix domain-containing protein [Nocardioides sp. SYSU D00514]
MGDYGQFCPIARSSELLAERWTPIIIRNLLNGCRTFSEIRQGAPGISTALLTQRLHTLERHGVLVRTTNGSGRGATYELTEMGRDLETVCDAMGRWGARWLELEPRHLDPAYVLWATTKLVDVEQIPPGTTAVRFSLRDQLSDNYWILLRRPQPELCTRGAGYDEDLVVRTDSMTLVDLHLRHTSYREALRTGRLELEGPVALTRRFSSWFRASPFAAAEPAERAGAHVMGVLASDPR